MSPIVAVPVGAAHIHAEIDRAAAAQGLATRDVVAFFCILNLLSISLSPPQQVHGRSTLEAGSRTCTRTRVSQKHPGIFGVTALDVG